MMPPIGLPGNGFQVVAALTADLRVELVPELVVDDRFRHHRHHLSA